MMKYKVISDNDMESVVEQVNELMEEGWVCQGGISIAYSRDQGYNSELYAQAMVKKGE